MLLPCYAVSETNKRKSFQYLSRVAFRFRNNIHYTHSIGIAYEDMDDMSKAIRYYIFAHQICPKDTVIRRDLADVLDYTAQYKESLQHYLHLRS